MTDNAPQPTTARWQPLRLGLVELYHYDAEEFWFEDGHLLLRGNNGTGKSKVLSLTLPFLLDASLSSARLEPDADPGKRMEWNLLMGGRFDRRTGYAWIEFGRLGDDGTPYFVTLGAACAPPPAGRRGFLVFLHRAARRPRSGAGDRTTDRAHPRPSDRGRRQPQRVCHGPALSARRRRAVFALGPERYRALIDTLIQLRQPQLSKQPNENNLSAALSQAFPPIRREVLEDVAEAMTQLDEYRDELDDYRDMAAAVGHFNDSYGRYAQILARRRARDLRRAQTAFDNASGEARQAREALATAQAALEAGQAEVDTADSRYAETGGQIEIEGQPEMRSARELHRAGTAAEPPSAMPRMPRATTNRCNAATKKTGRAGRREQTVTARATPTAARTPATPAPTRRVCLPRIDKAGVTRATPTRWPGWLRHIRPRSPTQMLASQREGQIARSARSGRGRFRRTAARPGPARTRCATGRWKPPRPT